MFDHAAASSPPTGLFGLSVGNPADVVTQLAKQGLPNEFALYLCPVPQVAGFGNFGSLVLGMGRSQYSFFSGSFQSIPYLVDPVGSFYDINVYEIYVNGQSINARQYLTEANFENGAEGQTNVLDSGTSRIVLNSNVWFSLSSAFTSAGFGPDSLFSNLCIPSGEGLVVGGSPATIGQFPTVSIVVGSASSTVKLDVAPSTYLQPSTSGGICIMFGSWGSQGSIFGVPLFQNYYTVFDRDAATVSFAPIANCNA
jgi:hypothetical protein